jgi:hypothetical protein
VGDRGWASLIDIEESAPPVRPTEGERYRSAIPRRIANCL